MLVTVKRPVQVEVEVVPSEVMTLVISVTVTCVTEVQADVNKRFDEVLVEAVRVTGMVVLPEVPSEVVTVALLEEDSSGWRNTCPCCSF